MESEKLFLVLVTVTLLSGQESIATDAFRAPSHQEAVNMARNLFTQERAGVVIYGGFTFFVDAICSIEALSLGVLDELAQENQDYVHSADYFEKFLEEEDKKASELIDKTLFNDEGK